MNTTDNKTNDTTNENKTFHLIDKKLLMEYMENNVQSISQILFVISSLMFKQIPDSWKSMTNKAWENFDMKEWTESMKNHPIAQEFNQNSFLWFIKTAIGKIFYVLCTFIKGSISYFFKHPFLILSLGYSIYQTYVARAYILCIIDTIYQSYVIEENGSNQVYNRLLKWLLFNEHLFITWPAFRAYISKKIIDLNEKKEKKTLNIRETKFLAWGLYRWEKTTLSITNSFLTYALKNYDVPKNPSFKIDERLLEHFTMIENYQVINSNSKFFSFLSNRVPQHFHLSRSILIGWFGRQPLQFVSLNPHQSWFLFWKAFKLLKKLDPKLNSKFSSIEEKVTFWFKLQFEKQMQKIIENQNK